MSLVRVPAEELKDFARDHDVDTEEFNKKPDIIKELASVGITFEDYKTWANAKKAEELVEVQHEEADKKPSADTDNKEPEEKEEKVLVRMNRNNPSFEYAGVEFTRNEPFQFLTRKEASSLIAHEDGFSRAHEDDVREFYNR